MYLVKQPGRSKLCLPESENFSDEEMRPQPPTKRARSKEPLQNDFSAKLKHHTKSLAGNNEHNYSGSERCPKCHRSPCSHAVAEQGSGDGRSAMAMAGDSKQSVQKKAEISLRAKSPAVNLGTDRIAVPTSPGADTSKVHSGHSPSTPLSVARERQNMERYRGFLRKRGLSVAAADRLMQYIYSLETTEPRSEQVLADDRSYASSIMLTLAFAQVVKSWVVSIGSQLVEQPQVCARLMDTDDDAYLFIQVRYRLTRA